jgi:hypothetical protein
MNLPAKYQVLVLFICILFAAVLGISGCAGVAEPLPSLSLTPNVLSVSAKVGTTSSQSATVTNIGTTAVSVNQAIVTGTGFSISGLKTPVELAPSQSLTFTIKFSAATVGNVTGSLAIMTDAQHRPVVLSLRGTAAKANPTVTSVSVQPAAVSPAPGGRVQFTAAVQGATSNDAVTWTATAGSVSASGMYTAPTSAATGMVTATSVADPTKSASAVVTVAGPSSSPTPPPSEPAVSSVTISPASASTQTGGTLTLVASVDGSTTNKAVTWHASNGSITAGGVFTAPATAGTSIVTASAVADPTKVGTATITVTAAPTKPQPGAGVTSVTVSPATASVTAGSTAVFAATVAGSATNKVVTWKAAVGTITAAGVYTAPAKAGADTVTATSVADPTKSDTSNVTVTAAPTKPTIPSVTSVTVSPSSTSLQTGGKFTFTASVAGSTSDKSVTWKAALGTVTAAGAYTAPAKAGTDTVTATSVADPTKSDTASVTVTTPPPSAPPVSSVTVSPAATSLQTGGKFTFSANVAGSTTNKSVTWKAALGTITAGGAYTAPAKAGTDTVTATSVADPTKADTASVTVTAPPPPAPTVTSVTVSPSTASSATGGTLTFTASVAGTTTNKAVNWKAALGSITASGQYTAPAKAGSDTVTATSVADATKSDTASVTVKAPAQPPPTPTVTGVSISPTSASAQTGGTLHFSATVSGTVTDKSVSWKAAVGKIDADGNYTAPSSAGTDTVTATSDADDSKSATAHVDVNSPAPPVSNSGALPAFPQAQGGGASSKGGRGGAVIEVTNLNDSGSGSLRACVQASGPRHCVFRVAGLIPVTSGDLRVDSPFLSIDGQTAPGQIILGGPNTRGEVLRISTHDVVVRYVTVSPDNYNTPSGPNTGTVGLSATNCQCYNIVIDHVSTRWAGNKMLIDVSNYVGPNRNITFQWSMLYEPHAMHPVGPGTSGNPVGCPSAGPDPNLPNPCFTTQEVQVDYHHSLFANIDHRIPENDNKSNAWNSNIVYNWSFYANEWLGPSTIDVVNNIFKPGNLNASAQTYPIHFSGNLSSELPNGTPSDYVSGNICRGDSSPAADQWGRCTQQISGENGSETGPVPDSWKRNHPDPRSFPITADPATSLDDLLLPTVGNSRHLDCTGGWAGHRDAADNRIINQYKTGGSGGFWPNGVTQAGPSSVPPPNSNYQDHPVTGFSACTESQHDGIPDQWKQMKGLSTSDPGLHNDIAPNGYTWLENYLNNQ